MQFYSGDEVLEVGGVSLRGKSALFVENLMNSIQNEFEIVVRRYIKQNQFKIINKIFVLVNILSYLFHLQLKFLNLKTSMYKIILPFHH
jgi:excinuclease UvrABC ATPase subunit